MIKHPESYNTLAAESPKELGSLIGPRASCALGFMSAQDARGPMSSRVTATCGLESSSLSF